MSSDGQGKGVGRMACLTPLALLNNQEGSTYIVEEPVKEAPKCMNDVVKNVQEELIEVNLSEGRRERMVKISKRLSGGEKRAGSFVEII